jgi:hypothetical protein
MKRLGVIGSAVLLAVLLLGCTRFDPWAATATPLPTHVAQGDTPAPTVLPLPSDTSLPLPTPTLVPTFTPLPPTPLPTPSAELLGAMDDIEADMELLRGLDATQPITRSLMTRDELAAYLEREMAQDYAPEEVEADVRVLAAFDFVPEDYDLRSLLVTLYSSQIIGFYDHEKKTLYVITGATEGGLDLLARMTFAHEYTHGLQDQHFGLDTFLDDKALNDDAYLARLSLVEGDASLAMTEYLYLHLDEITAQDWSSLESGSTEADQEALNAAPAIIRETFLFPYSYGLEFVSVVQEGGWDAVDAAYADPPQSTEQILHPEKYLARDEPTLVALPPLTDTLGAGWHLVEAETLGEFQTSLYLAQQVDQTTADTASAGWDGDQYAVYINGDDEVLVFATAWDSAADRQEFVDAYVEYAMGKYGQPPTEQGRSEMLWEAADQVAHLSWKDTTALLILGPDLATVETVLAAAR